MLHCAFLLKHLLFRADGGENYNNHQQQQNEEQDDDVNDFSDDATTIITTRAVESADKICWTSSLIFVQEKAVQVNTCQCYRRQRDIFEQILKFSTNPECERLDQLKEFLITEIQISDNKPEVVKSMTKHAIEYVKSSGSKGPSHIAKNLLQCLAYICFHFRCAEPVPHLIRAYEMLMERQKIIAPKDAVTWLPWFPCYNRSTVLYPTNRKQRWVPTLSFILLSTASCTITTTTQQPTTHVTKVSKLLYPVLEVPLQYQDKTYTPLGLACHQRQVSVCMVLLQHGSQTIIMERQQHRYQLAENMEQPLNVVVRDFNRLAVTCGQEEEQYRVFSILKLLLRATCRVRMRFVEHIGSVDCQKHVVVGNRQAVVLLDAFYQPVIGTWASAFDGVDSLRHLCRHAVRQWLKRNGCLLHGVKLLPITIDLKEVLMFIRG